MTDQPTILPSPDQASTITSQNPPIASKRPFSKIHLAIALVATLIIAGVAFLLFKSSFKTANSPATSGTNGNLNTNSAQATAPTVTPKTTTKITVVQEGVLALPKGHADPSVVRTSTGYRMYVNRQSGGPNGILIYNSQDGVVWKKEKDIVISGASTNRAIVLPTGVRIYYPQPQPIKPTDPIANMISSFSQDGLTFTKDPNIVLAPRDSNYYVEGPTVFQLPDKSWRMYFNENTVAAKMQRDGEIWGASSPDGINWTRDEKVTMQSDEVEAGAGNMQNPWKQLLHPFVLANQKGGYIMFYNSHSEMYAATSKDGMTWEKIGRIGIHGADMDGYFQDDGTIRVYYGDYNPTDGGLVYTAVLKIQ
jgi:hypothetical protein